MGVWGGGGGVGEIPARGGLANQADALYETWNCRRPEKGLCTVLGGALNKFYKEAVALQGEAAAAEVWGIAQNGTEKLA